MLETLTVTYHSFTWRSRTCQSVSVQPAIHFSPGIYMCHLSLLLHSEAASEFFSRREAESGTTLYFLGWGRKKKKTCCFLTLSYCCFKCDFQYVMIVCEGKWRTSVQEQLTCWWLFHSAGCVDVCVSVSCGFIHIGFQCAMCCLLGGWYLSCKCEILIWLFYYYINIYVKVWMVEPFRKVAFPTGREGVLLTLVYPSITAYPLEVTDCSNVTAIFRPKQLYSELLGCCTGWPR